MRETIRAAARTEFCVRNSHDRTRPLSIRKSSETYELNDEIQDQKICTNGHHASRISQSCIWPDASSFPQKQTTNVVALSSVAAAVLGSASVRSIALSGTATLGNAADKRTVPITLTVGADGSTTMTLQNNDGSVTESYPPTGVINCPNPPADTPSAKAMNSDLCWNSASWIMPTLALAQPSIVQKLGSSSIATSKDGHQFIVLKLYNTGPIQSSFAQQLIQATSERRVYLDATTLLPQQLRYNTPSRSPMAKLPPVEIDYSDYRPISGVQIPFHIQKAIDLQLVMDIVIASATVTP